jgi:hypothetical protein
MRRLLRIATASLVMFSAAAVCHAKDPTVPDDASALKITEKALIPIYGRKQVESERPFTAKLRGDVWTACGHLPEGLDGGVAQVKIDRRNGRILRVTHGK